MFKTFTFFTLCLSILLVSCSRSKNYKDAYGYMRGDQSFIKLKGKRQLMVHDLGSIFSNNTYEDSVILQVPSLQDGVVMGREIPVEEGYYKYLGEIVIQKEKLQVNLSFDNTDEKKAEPISWNGNYVFLQDSLEHAHNTNFVK